MSDHERHLCDTCLRDEYDEFAHDCIHKSIDQNNVWLEKYKINDWPRWDYSLEEATLTFSQKGVCQIQAIGSVQGSSWEWSWGNKNLPDSCKTRMHEVRRFGEEKQWPTLTTLFLDNDSEYFGWELASVSVHILNGIAVYRCPDSDTLGYFMYLVILSAQFVN